MLPREDICLNEVIGKCKSWIAQKKYHAYFHDLFENENENYVLVHICELWLVDNGVFTA